jgi:biopolymer transport protein TolR
MASAGGGAPSSNRRRSLDAELNLVPFIDLLSTCICFLLMTVVWVEIGALQVKQATGTEAAATTSKTLEMDIRFATPTKLELAVKGGSKKNQKYIVESAKSEDRLAKLASILAGIPGVFSAARVTTMNGVTYGDMVSVMDVLREHGIVNLGVVPVRK